LKKPIDPNAIKEIFSQIHIDMELKYKCKRPGKTASNDNFSGPSAKLVAGAGFEPTTFGL
jgi:hypothetical protein